MKILMLTQVLPYPPDSGPKVKTYNLLRYLAQSHDITLVSFTRGDQKAELEKLRSYCNQVYSVPISRGILRDGLAFLNSLISGTPWLITRDYRSEMRLLVEKLAQQMEFDAVHCDQINMAQYAPEHENLLRVFDAHNALWQLYQRMAETSPSLLFRFLYHRDWPLLKQYEGKICQSFDHVIAVSDVDAAALREAAGRDDVKIHIAPIAVDSHVLAVVNRSESARHILHIGTMYWQPNVNGVLWFIEKVLPIVREEIPDIEFDVIGARPPEQLRVYNQNEKGIHVTGYVEDVIPYIQQAGVFVVPLFAGSGMRVKILEAFARGIPVVSTQLGCEGIEVVDREHLFIADNPTDFAASVIHILNYPNEALQIAANSRKLIETRYDYLVALHPIDAIYPN